MKIQKHEQWRLILHADSADDLQQVLDVLIMHKMAPENSLLSHGYGTEIEFQIGHENTFILRGPAHAIRPFEQDEEKTA